MDPNFVDDDYYHVINIIPYRLSPDYLPVSRPLGYNSQLEMIKFLGSYVDIDIIVDCEESIPVIAEDSQTLKWIIQRFISRHTIQNVKFREKLAFNQFCNFHRNIGSLIKFALGGNKIRAEICHLKSSQGCTLLHRVLYSFGNAYHLYLYHEVSIECGGAKLLGLAESGLVALKSELHRLTDIIHELIMAESSLHEMSAPMNVWYSFVGTWRTPLLTLLDAFFYNCSEVNTSAGKKLKYRQFSVEQPLGVLAWLHHLKTCEKNLVEYGIEKQMLHRKYDLGSMFNLVLTIDSTAAYRYRVQKLLGLTFGPEPEDWKFYFTEKMDSSFIEFWDMIDHPERGMPGTWNSHDSRDYYDDVYRMEELRGPWHNFYHGNIPKAYEETFGRKFLNPDFGAMFDEKTRKWTTTI